MGEKMPEAKKDSDKKSDESVPPMGYPVHPGYYPPPPPGYPPPAPGYPPQAPGYPQPPAGYPPYPYYYPPPPAPSAPNMGLVAGIMLIIGGLIALLYGIYNFFLISFLGSFGGEIFFFYGGAWLYFCAAMPLLGGIIATIGGVFAIQRKHWAICLVGSILIFFAVWPILFGILALIFLILGKDEFES